MMKIDEMKRNDAAIITKVNGEGQLRKRILDLGLTKGTEIRLVRIAPLGDPVEIAVRGYVLTIRKNDASIIDLEPVDKKERQK